MKTHTPGPWHTEGFGEQSTVCSHDGLAPLAANLSAADARLIAAAPELLAACQDMLNVGMSVRAESVIWQELRAAVAKATEVLK